MKEEGRQINAERDKARPKVNAAASSKTGNKPIETCLFGRLFTY